MEFKVEYNEFTGLYEVNKYIAIIDVRGRNSLLKDINSVATFAEKRKAYHLLDLLNKK